MLKKEIVELINNQINKEYESSYLYLHIANFYSEQGLNGFANYFHKQSKEEVEHAEKLIAYLHNENEIVALNDIKASSFKFVDLREPLIAQIEHEEYITNLINSLYESSLNLKDYRTMHFLAWYINEQAEEETRSRNLLESFDCALKSNALYALDISLK